jgi:membrane protease YdiL (CAAX protease family)
MADLQPTQNRSLLATIFLSPQEPRLRAGWRLLIQTALYLVLAIIFTIIASVLGLGFGSLGIISEILDFLAVLASVYIARRWLDRRSLESLGLKFSAQSLIDIFAGIVISFLQMGFIYAVMLFIGWITFKGFAWNFDPINVVIAGVVNFFIVFIIVGFKEEILSRGYHLQTIASGINLFWGVIISSAIFGLLHLANPNATWISAAGIFFAGLYLAYGYIRTKQLWLSIGLHIGWNFFEGVVFGFPVSGLNIYPLLRIDVHGPVIWTGGAFGPEAGLIVLPSLILGAVLIYLYTIRRAE